MTATADQGPLRDAVLGYLDAQRRLLTLLDASGPEAAGIKAAMTAELDQLAAAADPRGRLDSRLRSDPGD